MYYAFNSETYFYDGMEDTDLVTFKQHLKDAGIKYPYIKDSFSSVEFNELKPSKVYGFYIN